MAKPVTSTNNEKPSFMPVTLEFRQVDAPTKLQAEGIITLAQAAATFESSHIRLIGAVKGKKVDGKWQNETDSPMLGFLKGLQGVLKSWADEAGIECSFSYGSRPMDTERVHNPLPTDLQALLEGLKSKVSE